MLCRPKFWNATPPLVHPFGELHSLVPLPVQNSKMFQTPFSFTKRRSPLLPTFSRPFPYNRRQSEALSVPSWEGNCQLAPLSTGFALFFLNSSGVAWL